MSAQKARLRAQFREIRARLDPATRARASEAMGARLAGVVGEARCVSAFWPLPGEVDLRPLLRDLVSGGATVALPAVVEGERPALVHRAMDPGARLVRGPFGVMQPPPEAPVVTPESVEIAIVPALALSRGGARLGYGGGYYDSFLAETRALRVGVAFSACLADALPAEPHDRSVAVVVTEREIAWTRNRGGDGA